MNIKDLMGMLSNVENSSYGKEMGRDKLIKGAESILPELLGQLDKNAKDPVESEKLDKALNDHMNDDFMSKDFIDRFDKDEADRMVDNIFRGDKHAVEKATGKSGLSRGETSTLLKILAPLAVAYLASKKQKKDLSREELSKETEKLHRKSTSGIGDKVKGFLDRDNDGSILDNLF